MKTRFLNNPGLKIASVVIAFALWLIIMNNQDPVITKTVPNVPVTVTNASYVESLGMSYHMVDNSNTVTVTVKGNRSVVESITSESIQATADLTEIVNLEADPITVPVRATAPRILNANITTTPATLKLELEEVKSADFMITPSVGNTAPANGFEVGKLTSNPDRVTLSGPASLISIIDRVEAPVSVNYLNTDTELKTNFVIYDKNGQVLSDTQLSYLKYSVDEDDIRIFVKLYRVVPDVTISVDGYRGTPKEGYQVTGVKTTPATISVVGDEVALTQLSENGDQILLPSSVVDAEGQDQSFDVRIEELSDYLPEGISLASGMSDIVILHFEVLPNNTRSYAIPTSSIERLNMVNGYTYISDVSEVNVNVRASDVMLDALDAEDISVSADLGKLKAGEHDVTLKVSLPSGYELAEEVTLHVTVSEPVVTPEASNEESAP